MPTAVPRIAPPWALPRGSTLLTLLSHVWGLFPSSPLRRFTLCFFSSWLPVGCSWPCSHLYLQSVQKALSTEQAPLLKAKGWAISICCSTSWILPETWFLFSSHPCTPWLRLHTRMCKHTHTHTHTLAHSKRERNKNLLPPLLVKRFHPNWPSSLRDLQDGSASDGGRIRQIRKQGVDWREGAKVCYLWPL